MGALSAKSSDTESRGRTASGRAERRAERAAAAGGGATETDEVAGVSMEEGVALALVARPGFDGDGAAAMRFPAAAGVAVASAGAAAAAVPDVAFLLVVLGCTDGVAEGSLGSALPVFETALSPPLGALDAALGAGCVVGLGAAESAARERPHSPEVAKGSKEARPALGFGVTPSRRRSSCGTTGRGIAPRGRLGSTRDV